MMVRVSVPSWSDNEGGLTLTLWDSPERKRRIGERSFTDVPDNAMVELVLRRAAPAGTYYWEVDRRTGTTRIGLYADPLAAETDDCAYMDGVPQRKLRFVFDVIPSALPTPTLAVLLHRLREGTPEEKGEACRGLAVKGDARAVPDLARLLEDAELSHMARLALQAIPGPAADAALRKALSRTTGTARIGIINSIGERRDGRAVEALTALLQASDGATASAAGVALGKIANRAAADALLKAVRSAKLTAPGVYEGALICADRLAQAGDVGRAEALYNALVTSSASEPLRMAATRGILASGGAHALDRLLRCLRAPDLGLYRVGLWALQRHVPGAEATRAVLAALETMPADRRATITEAIGRRGDAAAVPALIGLTKAADAPIRLAAIAALARLGGAEALATLAGLLTSTDPELAQAAGSALATLPREDVAAAATSLMGAADGRSRAAAIGLVLKLNLPGFAPGLEKALSDADGRVRMAAMQALGALGSSTSLPPLLDILVTTSSDEEAETAATAIASLAPRWNDADAAAGLCATRITGASVQARIRIVRVLGDLGTARALTAVREALKDGDGGVRGEAQSVLCAWSTADAAPDLLRLASEAPDPASRLRCLRGLLRLAGSADMPPTDRLHLCQQASTLIERDAEKRMLLGVLGQTGLPEAAALAASHLENAAVRDEACAAILAVAAKLTGPLPEPVRAALERVVALSGDAEVVRRARAMLGR
jgi:HEAT repeat protein